MVVSLEPIGTILPVVSFLFVFILIYALIVKTKVLDMSPWATAFFSLLIASLFIVNVQLVDFVNLNVSWFIVFIVSVFMILLMAGFLGKDALELLTKGAWSKGFLGVLIVILIVIFVYSSSYIFSWAISWEAVTDLMDQEWFGMALLIVIAAGVAYVLTKVKK
jgi:hypothetical protein